MKILLLEDDATLSAEIEKYFISKNSTCLSVPNGDLVEKIYKKDAFDIAILDINVPGKKGIEVCAAIRNLDSKIPILMLTAFGEITDKLAAFNKGADDYLIKPFHFEELYARVNALLKRKQPEQLEADITVADLVISNAEMKVFRAGVEVILTPKEFKLLSILALANGRIVSKNTISEKLWDYQVITNQNTIEVYINSLRKKIDKNSDVKLIHTKVGYGYFLKEDK
jgi:DNA-binding response OmpR family regulator